MILHTQPSMRIYFGDKQDRLFPHEYHTWKTNLLDRPEYKSVQLLGISALQFLKQTHGVHGYAVDHASILQPFSSEGDYLITNVSGMGIGVMTADCVPIIAHDKKNHAIGIAHAGWRGAVAGVIPAMIDHMSRLYHTEPQELMFYCGPSAKVCCYEVHKDFAQEVEGYFYGKDHLYKKPRGFYFDLIGFIQQQLMEVVKADVHSIKLGYNSCTICNPQFWSYRRDAGKNAPADVGRQMTIVSLC